MRKSLVVLTAVSLATICSSAAIAENRAGTINLTPVIGGYHWDGTQGVDANVLFGLNAGYNFTDRLGLEALVHYVHTKEYSSGSGKGMDAVNYRLEGLYHFTPQNRLVPFLAAGIGGLRSSFKGYNDDSVLFSYGGGVKYALTDNMALRGDARMMSVYYNPQVVYNYEYTLGLDFQFGGKKAAPAPAKTPAPEPAPAPKPAPAPAPLAPTSSLNAAPGAITAGAAVTLNWTSENASKCDITPGVGTVKPQGSMTVTPSADTTYNLSCSGPGGNTKSSTSVAVAKPLPPKAPAPTSSLTVTPPSIKQGESATLNWSSQNASKCAIQPVIGPVQTQGSMKVTPADNAAYTLTCEGAGGVATSAANVSVTAPQPVAVPKASAKLCSPSVIDIQFDTNKSDIKPKYQDELKTVADFLNEFPNAKGVIEGHTDNVGDKASNMKLSQRRADSVRNYLVNTLGVAPERIKAQGYGPTKPVADNKTKEGKAKNRRIEANFTCE